MTKINTLDKTEKKIKFISRTAGILRQLMAETEMREADLARHSKAPQSSINRILTGKTLDPRGSTLRFLAKFFGVTIEQLMGDAPLDSKREKGTLHTTNPYAWSHVPIIDWEDAIGWIFREDFYTPNNHDKWVITDTELSQHSFALISKMFMEPRFEEGSTLIIDPEAEKTDGLYAIVTFDKINVTAAKLIKDAGEIFFKRFGSPTSEKYDKDKHQILGMIVESKRKHLSKE